MGRKPGGAPKPGGGMLRVETTVQPREQASQVNTGCVFFCEWCTFLLSRI